MDCLIMGYTVFRLQTRQAILFPCVADFRVYIVLGLY